MLITGHRFIAMTRYQHNPLFSKGGLVTFDESGEHFLEFFSDFFQLVDYLKSA